jgi:pimeloyl-ACP methyl ester carboxylesterase
MTTQRRPAGHAQQRTIQANGIKIRIAEQGEGPLVLLIHGFPELWYSWRHQLPALAAAGYHAVALDLRGYGGSDAPRPIEAYSMKFMTADVTGVLDALGEEAAVVVGHDWGSRIAWDCALLHPDRFRAVVALSVPFVPRSAAPPTQLFKQVYQDNFFYHLYFQKPGIAEAELEADVRRSLLVLMYEGSGDAPRGSPTLLKKKGAKLLDGKPEPEKLPSWLTAADLAYYTSEFERTGFRGGLNRYRNIDRDWEELSHLGGAIVQQPALFICGEHDAVLQFRPPKGMKANVPNLKATVMIPGCGHWTQQERPADVNGALINFLSELT